MLAGHGNDAIWTHGGDDLVVLQGGDNTVFAGAGDDTIFLEGGRSVVAGDLGSDVFVVRNGPGVSDKILGFETGSDVVDLTNYAGLTYQDLIVGEADDSGNLTIALGDDPNAYVLEIAVNGEQPDHASLEEMFIFSDDGTPQNHEDWDIDNIFQENSVPAETFLETEAQAENDLDSLHCLA